MPVSTADDVSLALATRKKNNIPNFHCPRSADPGDHNRVRDFIAEYPDVKHRPNAKASLGYNCHGLTFGARRTGITDSADVAKILKDDGYRVLQDSERIWFGDVAIYLEQGEITHSGIVVFVEPNGTPWILSKWGRYHEAVHKPLDCPYRSGGVKYYRLEI